MTVSRAFLHIPPFPGSRPAASKATPPIVLSPGEASSLAEQLVRLRVGGSFWGARPVLPPERTVVLAPRSSAAAKQMVDAAAGAGLLSRAIGIGRKSWFDDTAIPLVDAGSDTDPWHIVDHAETIYADADDDLALVAALRGCRVHIIGLGRYARLHGTPTDDAVLECLGIAVAASAIPNPFTGQAWPVAAAVAQLGEWRTLIDQNRQHCAIYGIARWKRVATNALLWDGEGPVRYAGARSPLPAAGDSVLAWVSRAPKATMLALAGRGVRVGEIEDGMIRSQGLGANCVPPLSIIVDPIGVHFDPSTPSLLERILSETEFHPDKLVRAARLRDRLIATGLSKYGAATPVPRAHGAPSPVRRILVPGQVEDDRSVMTGGAGLTNLALLARVRALEPQAHITYRPHPDVEAGHRQGHIPDVDVLALADAIDRDRNVTDAIQAADALHVITSLAGFEALMRGRHVTTHGIPFYAGWGLTDDRGPVPARRGRTRTIDEMIAAVLILYPRYLDPVTRLPCPVEILVERLAQGGAAISSPLVRLRTLQGTISRVGRRYRSARR